MKDDRTTTVEEHVPVEEKYTGFAYSEENNPNPQLFERLIMYLLRTRKLTLRRFSVKGERP